MITRHHVVHCEYGGCRDWVRIDVATVAEARKVARRVHDWRRKDGRDYCPRHKP